MMEPSPKPAAVNDTAESLPPFAKAWMQQWRRAAVELPKVRDAELRQMGNGTDPAGLSQLDLAADQPSSGLIQQQRWFMRQRLLETRDD